MVEIRIFMDKDTPLIVKNCQIIALPTISDQRGSLSFGENEKHWPFKVERVFWTYNIKEGEQRSDHAHRTSQMVLFPLGGGWSIEIDDGTNKQQLRMDDPGVGILIPPLVWCRLYDFDKGACCVSLASDRYDAADYIHDYEEFLTLTKAR